MMRLSIFKVLLAAFALLAIAALPSGFTGATSAQAQRPKAQAKPAAVYACPMDADVRSHKPGKCHKCGMALKLVKTSTDETNAPRKTDAAPAAPSSSAAAAPRIPDTTVYDQHGRKLKFYSDLVKGRTVAINFIFTTCTTICPPLTATFRKVQQELGPRVGQDVQLLSISVDPTTDTPERLKSFAEKFKAGPGWTFVTGSKPEIDQLLAALGAAVADKNDHTPMILVGNDAAGYWTRTYGLASASTLVQAISEAGGRAAGTAAVNDGDTQVPMPGANASGAAEQQVERRVPSTPGKTAVTPMAAKPGASYFPNIVLLTQDNRPVHFYDDLIKNKVVLINFVFTTCQGACSPMTANLAKVQQHLGERLGKEIVMLSISVDPANDTPAVLKKYADNFKAKPGWYFLTGKKENVDWVLYKLGGYVEDKNQHGLALVIGNEATGEWLKAHAMSKPSDIADAALKLLAAN